MGRWIPLFMAAAAVLTLVVVSARERALAGVTCFGLPTTIAGTDGPNNLAGTPGNDVIAALGGNDTVDGNGGDDVICGGGGLDVLRLPVGDASVRLDGGPQDDRVEIVATANLAIDLRDRPEGEVDVTAAVPGTTLGIEVVSVEVLAGGRGNDVIRDRGNPDVVGFYGGLGNDRITGSTARDVLDGGPGNDIHAANAGPDVLVSSQGNDTFDGGPGADVITFAGARAPITASLALGTSTGDGSDTLAAIESITGGPRADSLTGDAGRNFIQGAGGNDTIDGGPGNDGLIGGDGEDSVTDVDGKNKIEGNDGDDFLRGGAGDDFIEGGDGDDRIGGGLVVGQGVDRIYGYKKGPPPAVFVSDDDIIGSSGSFIDGGPGDDEITNQLGPATTLGGPGNDIINAEGFMDGGEGDDILADRPGLFNSTLRGGPGRDILKPLEGNDTVSGGPGRDEVDYSDLKGFVETTIDLAAGSAAGGTGNDKLSSIEDAIGLFASRTVITGNGKNNRLDLSRGFGEAYGGAGNDTLVGGTDQDTLVGGDGFDSADGDGGFDDCEAELEVNCEGDP